MIDDRSQYEFVTVDEDIRVDGGIMPARDKAGDGSWAVLRGEDIAFCTEAVKERCRAVAFSESLRGNVTSEIRSDAWTDLIVCMSQVCHEFARASARLQPVLRNEPIPADATLANLFPDIPFQFSDMMSTPSDFGHGQPLRADGVRKVFHDLGIMTRWPVNCTIGRDGNEFSVTDHEGEDPPTATATNMTMLNHTASDFSETFIGFHGSETATISGGGIVVSQLKGSFEHAGSASVLIELEMWDDIVHADGTHDTTRFYYAWPFAGSRRDDGRVFVPYQEIARVARNISEGYFKTGETVGSENAQNLTVNAISARALVDLDEHTDFGEIGWDWPGE